MPSHADKDAVVAMGADGSLGANIDQVSKPARLPSSRPLPSKSSTTSEVPPPQWAGKRLAAELDSVPDFWLSGSFGGVMRGNVVHYMSGAAALDALKAGEADVAMATRAQIEHALAGNAAPQIKQRRGPIPALPSPGWDVGIAVKDDSRDLADALEAVMERFAADGTLQRLFAAHGVTHVPPQRSV